MEWSASSYKLSTRLNVLEYINEKLKDSMNCVELEYNELKQLNFL